jgi:hypothetical protein
MHLAQAESLCTDLNQELDKATAQLQAERLQHSSEMEETRRKFSTKEEEKKDEEIDHKGMKTQIARMEAENLRLAAELLAEKRRSETEMGEQMAKYQQEMEREKTDAHERAKQATRTEATMADKVNFSIFSGFFFVFSQ